MVPFGESAEQKKGRGVERSEVGGQAGVRLSRAGWEGRAWWEAPVASIRWEGTENVEKC